MFEGVKSASDISNLRDVYSNIRAACALKFGVLFGMNDIINRFF